MLTSSIRTTSASSGGAEEATQLLGGEDSEDAVHDGRLANARAARDDEYLGSGGCRDRIALRRSQPQSNLVLDPSESFLYIDGG